MKKYFWQYLFKDEEELKKHQARLNSINHQINNAALGCFYFFLLLTLIVIGALLLVSLFKVQF